MFGMTAEEWLGCQILIMLCAASWLGGWSFALYRSFSWHDRIHRWADKVVSHNEAERAKEEVR